MGLMALETCFQTSTMLTTRTAMPQRYQPFSSPEGLHMSTPREGARHTLLCSLSRGTRKPPTVCKASEAVDSVQVATDSSWDALVIANETPVLVEFWAPWCGPCKMIQPVIDELAKEYTGKISCFKVNTDESPGIATKYGIRSIPTVLFFKNGEKKESIIGAVPKKTLSDTIEKYTE